MIELLDLRTDKNSQTDSFEDNAACETAPIVAELSDYFFSCLPQIIEQEDELLPKLTDVKWKHIKAAVLVDAFNDAAMANTKKAKDLGVSRSALYRQGNYHEILDELASTGKTSSMELSLLIDKLMGFSLAGIKRAYILAALCENKGNIADVVKATGISKSALYRINPVPGKKI